MMSPRLVSLVCALAVVGCGNKDFECDGAVIRESDPTMIDLAFDTDEEGTSSVEFGVKGERTFVTPASDPGTHHSHLLLGMPGDADVEYTVTLDADGKTRTCEGSVHTGEASASLPAFDILVNDVDESAAPFVMLTLINSAQNVLVVVDRQGRPVWTYFGHEKLEWVQETYPDEDVGMNDIAIIQAQLWKEQKQIVFNLQSLFTGKAIGSMVWTTWGKEDLRLVANSKSHHAFAIRPDTGTIAYLKTDLRDWYDPDEKAKVKVMGDSVIELDTEDNEVEIFNTWDEWEVVKHDRWDVNFYEGAKDWTHGNAVTWFPDRESYILSFANIDTFLEFVPGQGIEKMYEAANVSFAEGSEVFEYQHDPRWGPDGTVSLVSTLDETKALVYDIGDDGTFTEIWSHASGDQTFAFALGENHLLPNGDRLIGYGSAARLQEVTEDGAVVWDLEGQASEFWLGSVMALDDFYAYE